MVENLLKVSSFQKISRYVSTYSVTDLKVKKPTVIQACRHRGAGTGGGGGGCSHQDFGNFCF